jgi:hypothetical protein
VPDVGPAALLRGLVGTGTQVLTRVPWPGGRDARLAAVLVGPSGVWLVEHRTWPGVAVRGGRLYRARQDVTEDLLPLAELSGRLTGDLVRVGLVPGEVQAVLSLARRGGEPGRVAGVRIVGERDLAATVAGRGRRLSAAAVDVLLARVREIFGPGLDELAAEPPGAPSELLTVLDAAPPPPPWTAFLDAAQAGAAWRRWPGPLRVRGLPGSGTSVVAVHRAVHLARTWEGPVALVAPTAGQVGALRSRVMTIAPELVDRVVVARPAELARRVLTGAGIPVRDDPALVGSAWSTAERSAGVLAIGFDGQTSDGRLRNEVLDVVRGRGLTEPAAYQDLRPDLPAALRHRIWVLAEAYAAELHRCGVPDDHDLVRIATEALAVGSARPGFDAVVVDGAQDLTLGALRFVAALAGDGEDALTVLDDGLPGLAPVGPTLREAGIDVADRVVDLEVSHRLSIQSWAYAVGLLTADGVPDLAGATDLPRVRAGLVEGAEPVYVRSAIARLRRAKLVGRLLDLLASSQARPGDAAVLYLAEEVDPDLLTDLAEAGLPVVGLAEPDPGAVHVGTVGEARGLEFDHVLVADAPHRMFVDEPLDSGQRVLARRALALAVTRARTGVWIGGV